MEESEESYHSKTPKDSSGSKKEPYRPSSDQIPLIFDDNEVSVGSKKEKISISKSSKNQSIYNGSEKEELLERSDGSRKESVTIKYSNKEDGEVSSLNSAKEELVEISIGSSKEFEQPSSEENDNESMKSRYISHIDVLSQSESIEESKKSKISSKASKRLPISSSKDRHSSKDSVKEDKVSNESDLSRKDLPTENSFGSSKEQKQEITDGSSKEVYAENNSEESIKEIALKSDNFDEINQSNFDSTKEGFKDSDISSVKVRLISSAKDYLEGSSLGSEKEQWDLNSTEYEMNGNVSSKQLEEQQETEEESNGSLKEEEIEESTGSLKEEYYEKSEHSSKELLVTKKDSSIQDGDLEDKESSKELFRSIEEFKESDDYTPSKEESEEDEAQTISIKPERLSSHPGQASESEWESTPK